MVNPARSLLYFPGHADELVSPRLGEPEPELPQREMVGCPYPVGSLGSKNRGFADHAIYDLSKFTGGPKGCTGVRLGHHLGREFLVGGIEAGRRSTVVTVSGGAHPAKDRDSRAEMTRRTSRARVEASSWRAPRRHRAEAPTCRSQLVCDRLGDIQLVEVGGHPQGRPEPGRTGQEPVAWLRLEQRRLAAAAHESVAFERSAFAGQMAVGASTEEGAGAGGQEASSLLDRGRAGQ